MSDVRYLPLLGRDLPDYNVVPLAALNRPQRAPVRNKARVFKDGSYWVYTHQCPTLTGFAYLDHAHAFWAAQRHMGWCGG